MTAGPDERQDFEVTEETLHAFADGQLEIARRGDVEAFLATHPDKAAEVARRSSRSRRMTRRATARSASPPTWTTS